MTMQFFRQNRLATSTMLKVDSNTATAGNLLDRDLNNSWVSSGYTGVTKTTISIEFGSATVLDKVMIQNHNLKDFRVFYNSVTANTFTPNISVTSNSETSSYFTFATTTVSSLQLQIDTAQTGVERSVGELVATNLLLTFERNPAAPNYNPTIYRKQIRYEMPDGGVTLYNVDDKFRAKISWRFITEGFKNSLLNIYETATAFYFVPFGTTTSWDGKAYEVAWSGIWDFKHGDNNKDAGFSGNLTLEETA